MPSGKGPRAALGMALTLALALALCLTPAPGAVAAGPGPGELAPVTMSCLAESARRFGVPVRALGLIMAVEAGRVGEIVKNRGGSYDMGPMQINSFWLPLLGAMGVGEREVVGDGCVNVAVGAWILRSHLGRTGSLAQAVADYHSLNPVLGKRYLRAARARLRGLDLGQTLMRANSGLARGAGR